MEVKHYKLEDGSFAREIISKNHSQLSELKKSYERDGYRAWLNLYDGSKNKWMLSIYPYPMTINLGRFYHS